MLARKVVEPGTPALAQIVRAFGPDVLLPDGRLDRAKLGRVVFADEDKRRTLNGIVHPAVRREMFWSILRCWWRGERVCVLDVPLLIEGGLWKWVGKVVVVYWCVQTVPPCCVRRNASGWTDTRHVLCSVLRRSSCDVS